jgi:GT2 family glycosyltransferase
VAARVSVVIPTFDRAELVLEAVQSVVDQTYPDVEVLVVDDGSTDGTEAAVRGRFGADARVRFFRKENGGAASARNHGIERATGSLIALLDSDDRQLHGHLARQAAALEGAPGADLAVCDAVYQGGRETGRTTVFARRGHRPPTSLDAMCAGAWAFPSTMTFRAEALRALRFDEAWYAEDTELLFRFFASGRRSVVVDEPLVVYRTHPGQKMESHAKNVADSLRLLETYGPRSGDRRGLKRHRAALHRAMAKALVRDGRHREARPHLWAWWRSRPWRLRPLLHLVRGTLPPASPPPRRA